jgi:hypothetical protein
LFLADLTTRVAAVEDLLRSLAAIAGWTSMTAPKRHATAAVPEHHDHHEYHAQEREKPKQRCPFHFLLLSSATAAGGNRFATRLRQQVGTDGSADSDQCAGSVVELHGVVSFLCFRRNNTEKGYGV